MSFQPNTTRRRNRPTAFEVSFANESTAPGSTSLVDRSRTSNVNPPANASSSSAPSSSKTSRNSSSIRVPSGTVASSSHNHQRSRDSSANPSFGARNGTGENGNSGQKRKSVNNGIENSFARNSMDKRPRFEGRRPRYVPHEDDIQEEENTAILGEDRSEDFDPDDKPIRLLNEFSIFDSKHSKEMVSLDTLESGEGDGALEAAGFVAPVFINEEDVGQEDDGDDEEEDGSMVRLHTTVLYRYTIDYTDFDDPVYIETHFAWYILKRPSQEYRPIYNHFYRPLRVAQMVISMAVENRDETYESFCEVFLNRYDEQLGTRLDEPLIKTSKYAVLDALEAIGDDRARTVRNVPLIKHIIRVSTRSVSVPAHRPPRTRPVTSRPLHRSITGNLDVDLLRPENQSRTTVTPLIDQLASGLFHEHLEVLGPKPRQPDKQEVLAGQKRLHLRLLELIREHSKDRKHIGFPFGQRLKGEYWKCFQIQGQEYMVNDIVIVPAGNYQKSCAPDIPTDLSQVPATARAADYFWFAKIISINQRSKMLHVQWFHHASQSILQEISDPQELFLTEICDPLDISLVVGKATVVYGLPKEKLDSLSFFCNMMYNEKEGTFTSIPSHPESEHLPPDNCPVCLLEEQHNLDLTPREIKDGVAYHGKGYHINDYVLIQADASNIGPDRSLPCFIGQITDFRFSLQTRDAINSRSMAGVTVQLLGRVCDLDVPKNVMKDEQHLFFTDQQMDVSVENIVQQCRVIHPNSCSKEDFAFYLSQSPLQFYAKYLFSTDSSLQVQSWDDKEEINEKDVLVCHLCCLDAAYKDREMKRFLELQKKKSLRVLDPFGGVGAFGLGMESAGCMKTTHAIEISPSAATTLQKNSPETVVYNQCSNVILRYAIKKYHKHDFVIPKALDTKVFLPPPPNPTDIDCIVAGFPCQPHSRLNMFQKANDKKSHLILNLLSWVDFMKPRYCYFENVRGFLNYNLNAMQASRYRVTGGVNMGGLKFVVRALLAMDYQVRFGLLQAAHYGAPQSRVRFFLIASQHSLPLPPFPQPTHDFPLKDHLEIKFPNCDPLRPIRTAGGTAPCRFVSIDDAIGDLPWFDWALNSHVSARKVPNPENPVVQDKIPAVYCDKEKFKCGITAQYRYRHPRTSFQARCREKPVTDLQQFTRVLKLATVERVINIPLTAGADYRTLTSNLWEWQFSNASSSIARGGFRAGLYGRLDKDGWFHTTVTNVEPTAKQSWVLNPYCKRVVTVRELARSQGFPDWFIFYSKYNDVKTMHRQIGNAVPWPVSLALGRELRDVLFIKWLDDQSNAIIIE